MKKLLGLLFISLLFQTADAQKSIIPHFIRRMVFEKDSSRRSSFIPLPVLSYAQEKGVEAGLSTLYSFYSDTSNHNTRVSNLFVYGTLTTKGQSRLGITGSYWLPNNKLHLTLYGNYINFPFTFYGLGDNTRQIDAEKLGQHRFKFNLGAEKLVFKNVYLGILAGVYDYSFTSTTNAGVFETDPNIFDRNGGGGLQAGPTFIYDTRNNNTYTTKGFYINSNYSFTQGVFSANHFTGGLLSVQVDEFISLSKKLVLAIDAYDNSLFGNRAPFYLLPTMGNDSRMRGYYNGRYRDNNYLTAQTELRYRLSDRLGLVGFAGTGTVFNTTFNASALKPNYGGGIRYFFDVEKGISIRLDYGVGEQRPGEQRQSGFYVGLGEAF